MKVVRTGILLILAFSGLLLLAQPSEANPAFFYSFAYSHPGWCYYHPWALSFGFGYWASALCSSPLPFSVRYELE